MNDEGKTKEQLIRELVELRQQIAGWKASEIEHRQAEEVLGGSEEKNHRLINDILDSSKVGVFILDSDFRVVWLNQALESYFGIRRAEVIGKDKRQLIHAQIKNIFEDSERFAEKVLATYENNSYVENFECHVLPDGERQERWLEHWSQPIPSGSYAGGRIEHYTDITERKKMEETLKNSEEKYYNLVNNANDAIVSMNREGIIVTFNKKAEEMYGWSSKEILGKSIILLIPPQNRQLQEKALESFQTTGEIITGEVNFELKGLRKDGGEFYVEPSFFISKAHGESIITAIIRDITERIQAEKTSRESKAELEIKTNKLEELNSALRVLLKRRDEDKKELEEKVLSNVKEIVLPYLARLKKTSLDAHQKNCVSILESNLKDIISPFSQRVSSKYLNLTPKEIMVANLIKEGKSTKEIAAFFNLSSRTIEAHRENIRRKTGIKHKKANLRSYLLSF